MVMAGSGNLQVFQRIQKLYQRLNPSISFGDHLGMSMSLGLLFLSHGTMTLSNSDFAIACLLCSFFPRYPTCFWDNRSHLQILRHLWTLAVEERCLKTRDVSTQQYCSLPMTVTMKHYGGSQSLITVPLITPCMLPPLDLITSIKTHSPRYWSNEFSWSLLKEGTLWVKRKTGYLSYLQVISIIKWLG
jgi:anaphase-promoting complex subunit 1